MLLATGARMIYCSSPVVDSTDCWKKAASDYYLALITCDAVEFPTTVSLVTPEIIEQIEAEPLLELLDPEEQKKFEAKQAVAVEEKFAKEQEKLAQVPKTAQQVVEITRPNVEAPPENARFLSEYDSRTEKETVARGSTEAMTERPQARELTPKDDPREAAVAEVAEQPRMPEVAPEAPEAPGKLSMRDPGTPKPNELEKQAKTPGVLEGSDAPLSAHGLEAARGNSDMREKAKVASEGQTGEGGGGGGRPLVPDLRPSEDVLERALGGGSVDKLDGVESGKTTALNARRWKYASFFNRMKRRVAQNWHPGVLYARRDPTGNVYGGKNRVTLVKVSLSRQGAVTGIHVVKGSGIDFLDDEAVRAFQAAQPFPNPPEGLVDQRSNRITFTFGFHFEVGHRSGWKIFRQR